MVRLRLLSIGSTDHACALSALKLHSESGIVATLR